MAVSLVATPDSIGLTASNTDLDGLLPVLQWLDRLLQQAVTTAQVVYGAEAATDPYRGLHIEPEEFSRWLARKPGAPLFSEVKETLTESAADHLREGSRLARLKHTFGLSAFDMDVVAIALAPEIDLRYERLYAYLQDDVTRRRPNVNLVLDLLCSDAPAKLARQAHFAGDAPLVRQGLLEIIPDPHQVQPPFLSHYLKLDEQVRRFLLGQPGLDPRLAPCCELIEPAVRFATLSLDTEIKQGLEGMALQNRATQESLLLYFQGSPGLGQRSAAEALAATTESRLLAVNLAQALGVPTDFAALVKRVCQEARFQQAVLYLEGLEALQQQEQTPVYGQLLAALSVLPGITIITGTQPWVPAVRGGLDLITVPFMPPDFARRRACWQAHLTASGISLPDRDLDNLTDRFRLSVDQIAQAIAMACTRVQWRAAIQMMDGNLTNRSSCQPAQAAMRPTRKDLFAAARAQSGYDLGVLARKIEPRQVWNDIVLPPEPLAQLQEMCQQAQYRHVVYGEWGFARKLSLGKGLNALFTGTPGTGKTMAAEVIAAELQLDLYKIDLSQVVSKYIGETEKNLDRIFTAAENANAILLFDEADALFGKRSEIKDAHDRYANLEVAYLLQKMEEYEGITILTSNLRQNLDEAFTRRLRFIIGFPFPEEQDRRRIWQGIWPSQTPLGPDVDLNQLAKRFKLTGGNIRNIALAAAFLAAGDRQMVGMNHILQAAKREFRKMGRLINEAEFLLFGAEKINRNHAAQATVEPGRKPDHTRRASQ
jgi:AAA+ superfamily predicted ATPase